MIDGLMQLELPPHGESGSFVVGPENRIVVAAVADYLDPRGPVRFSPLVIIGPTGSGKSHLAQGIIRKRAAAERAGASSPPATLSSPSPAPDKHCYFTAADFARDAHAAKEEDRLAAWRAEIRSLDLLVIENLQDFRPRSPAQIELRACLDAGPGAILITADCEPSAINHLDLGLRDRVAAGLTIRLERPGVAARRQILSLAAESHGWTIDDADLGALSRRDVGAVSQLFGELAAHVRRRTLRDDAIGPPAATAADGRATLRQILAATARYFGVTQAAITGQSRKTAYVRARNVVVCLARRLTDLSYSSIGHALGGRDHTTIMHAEVRLAEQAAADPALARAIEELDRMLR